MNNQITLTMNHIRLSFYRAEKQERWAVIPGTAGLYEASTLGRIKSHHRHGRGKRGHLMSTTPNAAGYHVVTLHLPHIGKNQTRYVHELVLLTFIGPRPEKTICAHWDDNKDDNSLANLRYDIRANNVTDARFNKAPDRQECHSDIRVAVTCAYSGRVLAYLGDIWNYPNLFAGYLDQDCELPLEDGLVTLIPGLDDSPVSLTAEAIAASAQVAREAGTSNPSCNGNTAT